MDLIRYTPLTDRVSMAMQRSREGPPRCPDVIRTQLNKAVALAIAPLV
jgi:hypothetical protein